MSPTTVDQHRLTARLMPSGIALGMIEARVTLDESWSPYAQASLTCHLPDAVTQARIDLRDGPMRLELSAQQFFATPYRLGTVTADVGGSMAGLTSKFGGKPLSAFYEEYSQPWNSFGRRASTSRRFNLTVTERSFDHLNGELSIEASSDEARLQAYKLVASSVWTPGTTSVRAIVVAVLDRIGADLEDGDTDGTVEVDATRWEPGTDAWAYLAPLLQSVDLRLWCDEAGTWRLTKVQPTRPGSLLLTPTQTITELVDRMSVAGDEWFDAVVVTYKWTDGYDLNQTAHDIAGAEHPRNVLHIEHETPYPGPGAAAAILSRARGRGRVLEVRAVSDYRAQPGQPATITPEGTDAQTGYVASVQFEWPAAEMNVKSRGLVDTPETAWRFVPSGITWADVPEGLKWADYTPEALTED